MEGKLILTEKGKETFRNMTEKELDVASRQIALMMNYQIHKIFMDKWFENIRKEILNEI